MSILKGLQNAIGYAFKDESLLDTAITHSTYANEHRTESYQRLEYLGDSILDFIVSEYLYARFPKDDEGDLTEKRKDSVSHDPLEKAARKLGFEKYLKISPHVNKDSALEDMYEAVVAAIYLDGGMECAKKFVLNSLKDFLEEKTAAKDNKSALNEARPHSKIIYKEISRSGPPHDPVFEIELEIDGKFVAREKAGNKKEAEQKCAAIALEKLKTDKNSR